jgi:plasmid replication initiation protein
MNSSYDLSLEEQKIILTLASMVQPTDDEFKTYKFRIADFLELLGIEDQSKYTEIPKITKGLMKKVLEIQEGNSLLQVAWLNSARYEKGSGEVILRFSPDLKPYMLKLGTLFTQYQLRNILSMKSKYSPRIYEFLKANEFKTQGYIEIEMDELRRLLKAEDIYPRYNDFKKYVIERAQKELKKVSDISFEFEEIKTGRKITSLKFYIKSSSKKSKAKNEEIALTIEDDEVDPVIEEVRNIMNEHDFTDKEIKAILKSANGDIERVRQVYNHFKNKRAANFIGLMVSMVKPEGFAEPQDSNTAYADDRGYDYEELEKKIEDKMWQ